MIDPSTQTTPDKSKKLLKRKAPRARKEVDNFARLPPEEALAHILSIRKAQWDMELLAEHLEWEAAEFA